MNSVYNIIQQNAIVAWEMTSNLFIYLFIYVFIYLFIYLQQERVQVHKPFGWRDVRGKTPLGRYKHKWKNNIKRIFKKWDVGGGHGLD